MRKTIWPLLFVTFALRLTLAQAASPPGTDHSVIGHSVTGNTLVVLAFENTSRTANLEWIGESFPEVLRDQLNSPLLYVVDREDRLRGYDRIGIPARVPVSRPTLYRIAEQMDLDLVVLGEYSYEANVLTATAQVLDMRRQKLLAPLTERGALPDLIRIESALAWGVQRQIRPDFTVGREEYLAKAPALRLNALENYVRGIVANGAADKIKRLQEAVRLSPEYDQAWLELGKTYFAERQYAPAAEAFGHVTASAFQANEANFYLGLASFYQGDWPRAETAFAFVAARLPLSEVYNNLGVAQARRGSKRAEQHFRRAAQNDPGDADYHFNLGVALARGGDLNGAGRQLHQAITLRPNDTEAKALLDQIDLDLKSAPATPPQPMKLPLERIKRNYAESSFRQLDVEIQAAAEQKLAKTDPRTHARYHAERGKELLAHGFAVEAEKEFREALRLDATNADAQAGLAQILELVNDSKQTETKPMEVHP